jgi:hypothetical protein
MTGDPSGDMHPHERHRTSSPHADPAAYIECDVPLGMTLGEWAARDERHERTGFGATLLNGARRLGRRRAR